MKWCNLRKKNPSSSYKTIEWFKKIRRSSSSFDVKIFFLDIYLSEWMNEWMIKINERTMKWCDYGVWPSNQGFKSLISFFWKFFVFLLRKWKSKFSKFYYVFCFVLKIGYSRNKLILITAIYYYYFGRKKKIQ